MEAVKHQRELRLSISSDDRSVQSEELPLIQYFIQLYWFELKLANSHHLLTYIY